MGTLYYGASRTPLVVDDRLLAHLKVVTTAKLRRNEPFLLSWTEPLATGSGRGSVWLHPASELIYRFEGSRTPELDKDLLESLSIEAGSSAGLRLGEAIMPRITS